MVERQPLPRRCFAELIPLLTDERGRCRVCGVRRRQDCIFDALSAASPDLGDPECETGELP
jgi:hypothetical protein